MTFAKRSLCAFISSAFIATPAFAAISAANDNREVPQDTAVVIDVLFNDTTDGAGLTVAATTAAAHGTVTIAAGGVRYQPATGFYGADTFSYTVQNNAGEQATAVVTVTVVAEAGVVKAASIAEASPQAANTVMRSHRDAVSQFLDGGSYASLNDKEVARLNGPLGGSAGEDGLSFGGIFMNANSRSGEQKAGDMAMAELQKGYDDNLSGFTLGADALWGNSWVAGAALGYSTSSIEFVDGKGDFDLDDMSLLGFAAYRTDTLSIQTQLGYSDLAYTFGAPNDSAVVAENAGNNRFAFIKGQYTFHTGGWQFIPGLSLNYQNQFTEAYIEKTTAANPVPSSFSSQKNRSLQSGLSLHIDRAVNFNWGVFLPRIAVTAEQTIASGQTDIQGYAAGKAFTVTPTEADKNQMLFDVGASFVLPRGLAVFLNFQGLVQGDYSSNAAQLGLRKEL